MRVTCGGFALACEAEAGRTATLVRLKFALTRTLSARAEASPQGGRVGFGYDISYD